MADWSIGAFLPSSPFDVDVHLSSSQGNELVEAILDGPIVVIKDPRTEKNRVIDPGHIGRQLMSFRQSEAKLVTLVSASADAGSFRNKRPTSRPAPTKQARLVDWCA